MRPWHARISILRQTTGAVGGGLGLPANMGLIVVLIFLWIRFSNALECYSCSNENNVTLCSTITTCQNNEVCSHVVSTDIVDSTKSHTLGCVPAHYCDAQSQPTAIGRQLARKSTTCKECCSTEVCNQNLCNHDMQGVCQDDPGTDCAKMQTFFNVCQDKQHAKLVCRHFCRLCDLVDGVWSDWGSWGDCSVTCGSGRRARARSCNNPSPANDGLDCTGNASEHKTCTLDICPLHGGWGSWHSWGTCSVTCDLGMKSRDRLCNNPTPSRFGDHCFGSPLQDNICIQPACSDGGWSSWGTWGSCSVTCGGGFQTRSRDCTNPRPSLLGRGCIGKNIDVGSCNSRLCAAPVSMFSVDNPYNRTAPHSSLSFSHTISNTGDFNPTTGVFTCSVPGNYYFSVSLTKKRSSSGVDLVGCNLYKNYTANLMEIRVDPWDDDTDKGNAEASNSVIVHLNRGDTIILYACSDPSTHMESWSSFTGYLVN